MSAVRGSRPKPVAIYAKSVAEALRRNLTRSPAGARIFSPYLTSRTAETVIGSCCPETSEIHTVFSAEQFATGASSIRTVIKLLERGYSLFHIPDLHAKVTLTEDFAAVGSQNLTARGTRNREVTALITDLGAIAELRVGITPWLELRQPITLEMARDMDRLVGPLARQFKKLKQQFKQADQDVADAETARQERERREREEALRLAREARLRELQDAVAACPASKEVIRVRLETKYTQNYGWNGPVFGHYMTLGAANRREDNLLDWTLDGERITLQKTNRYLIIDQSSGRLAWVAFNKGQLTRFATAVSMNWAYGDTAYRLELDAPSPTESDPANLVATISRPGLPGRVTLRCFVNMSSLRVLDVQVAPDSIGLGQIVADARHMLLRYSLQLAVVTPFKYDKNSIGAPPSAFLGRKSGSFWIRIHTFDRRPFCTIEPT